MTGNAIFYILADISSKSILSKTYRNNHYCILMMIMNSETSC